MSGEPQISAIILAAGASSRMGRPKLNLPWRDGRSVIGQVVHVLAQASLAEILLVGGKTPLHGVTDWPVHLLHNPDPQFADMLGSLQCGLRAAAQQSTAALVVLGDQPQIELEVVKALLAQYAAGPVPLLLPSYQMRRGHPWLIDRSLWPAALELQPPQTLRDLLQSHVGKIAYLNVDTPSVLQDLDTPEDYERFRSA